MSTELFLARTEEQEKFRQVLSSLLSSRADSETPFVFLFYGEGGMGKTRLAKRLQDIAQTDETFAGKFNTLFVDWESKRFAYRGLQVGHGNVDPNVVLNVLYDELAAHLTKLLTPLDYETQAHYLCNKIKWSGMWGRQRRDMAGIGLVLAVSPSMEPRL